jgi:exodeoxyribonuclease VII small subunit
MTPKKNKSETYAENRAKLKEISEKLKNSEDIDIDSLIPMIEEATSAYKICKERIDQVEKLLQEKLQESSEV